MCILGLLCDLRVTSYLTRPQTKEKKHKVEKPEKEDEEAGSLEKATKVSTRN